ncbi:polysaccharide deacetylase family protein [Pontibacter qinzhouensis]|uniref:Polysaccharide deacetylase family protein n=1 Tax=Pontibacter qinzhouensis TaxID=2603253 RepID=A0A5C8INM4_9BACT|nr:polysaccharide deacetylase family protein [Pontibacter qinzhouensis]TXK23333.1 polysaccharide deacetylase family protein [Pontibacter qinzhouensis]
MRAQLRNIYRRFFEPRGLVLMYHRVAEPASDVWDIAVSPANFEVQLQLLKKLGTVMPLNKLVANACAGTLQQNSIAITFDDGYLDNYATAKPLLEHYKLPATFFVATGNIGQQREFWWDELEEIILYRDELPPLAKFRVGDDTVSKSLAAEARLDEQLLQQHQNWHACTELPPTQRSALFFELWQKLRPLPAKAQQQHLQQIRNWAGVDATVRQDQISMSEDQLVELSSSDLFDIGAHTVSHPALAFHSKAVQKQEIAQNVRDLQVLTGTNVSMLAYPYGNYNNESVQVAEELGFMAALTTEEEIITKKSDAYRMGRFQVSNWNKEEFAKKMKQWMR